VETRAFLMGNVWEFQFEVGNGDEVPARNCGWVKEEGRGTQKSTEVHREF